MPKGPDQASIYDEFGMTSVSCRLNGIVQPKTKKFCHPNLYDLHDLYELIYMNYILLFFSSQGMKVSWIQCCFGLGQIQFFKISKEI